MLFDVKLYNIIVLGFCFMLIFTSFQTCGIIQQVVIESIHKENPEFEGDGFISLAIIYATFAASNWVAPSIVSFLGPKFSMVAGAITYSCFVASFLHPLTWLLYLTSAVMGIGAACIWTGQGNFLTINSNSETIARNSGVFWAMLQSSMLFGNLFVYFTFQGKTEINKDVRTLVFSVLLGVGIAGLLLLFALRSRKAEPEDEKTRAVDVHSGPVQALVRSVQLFQTKEMILLGVSFFYTGLELSFFSGVYGTAIGFTQKFGVQAKPMMGLNGILIGVGEIIGGAAFGLLGKRTNRYGRDPIFLLGFVVHVLSFFLVFLNIPDDANMHETAKFAYITSSPHIALLVSFLLGFGDSCFNTQIYSILGFMYPDDSAPAFALFKFIQSLAAAVSFVYSNRLLLHWQLLILVISGTIGTLTFCIVEWQMFIKYKLGFPSRIQDSTANEP